MIYHDGKEIGFVYKDDKNIERIYLDSKLFFEQGFTREISATKTPVTFRNLQSSAKNYRIFGNTVQNGIPYTKMPVPIQSVGDYQKDTGKYKISVTVQGEKESASVDMYLNAPLYAGDYVDYANQCVVRNTGITAFDGTEAGWSLSGSLLSSINQVARQARIPLTRLEGIGTDSEENTINSHFTSQYTAGGSMINTEINYYNMYPLNTMFDDFINNPTNLLNWKDYLASQYAAGTPVTVVYPLETPVTEKIQLPKLPLFKGMNSITVNTEIQPSEVYVKYKGI